MRVIILGAGGAGLSAARTLLEHAPNTQLTLVSQEECPPYSPVVLPYYIEGRLDKEQMCLLNAQDLPPSVALVTGSPVQRIEPARHRVVLADGRALAYDRLVIGTGATPVAPDLPALRGARYAVLRTLADAEHIVAAQPRKTAVLGAGPVAVELAVALKKRGLDVSLIVRSRIMRRLLDPDFSAIVEDLLAKGGVDLLLGQHIKEVHQGGSGSTPDSLEILTNRTTVQCDLLVVAMGVKPNLDFLEDTGIAIGASGGIIVDETMRTNDEHIYAVGDCAETTDLLTGERGINAIWPEAITQGRVAALSILGFDVAYHGGIPRNVINVFATPVYSAGSLIGEKVTTETPLARIRHTFADGHLVGTQIIGEVRPGSILAPIVKAATHPNWLASHLRLAATRSDNDPAPDRQPASETQGSAQ
jgi:NADPH-dependent 2,4-dienoyl-CoA reductase/sulfur reductase-like enzyme